MLVPGKKLQVFSIKETPEKPNEEKKTWWVKAGTAWVNRDGSLNVYLDVLPLDGKLHVREFDEKRAESNNGRAAQSNGSTAQEATLADSMGGH